MATRACQKCGGHGFHGEYSQPKSQQTCIACGGRGTETFFRVRFAKPKPNPKPAHEWYEMVGSSPEDAAMSFHARRDDYGYRHVCRDEDGGWQVVRFALVEVEGHGLLITRMWESMIYRESELKDGPGLEHIARQLKWTQDPKGLLESGWTGEE